MSINFELLDAAIEDAATEANGIKHRQAAWYTPGNESCGTGCCLAGFIALRTGAKLPTGWLQRDWSVDMETGEVVDRYYSEAGDGRVLHVSLFAEQKAGLSNDQAMLLFDEANTLDEIRLVVAYLREHPDAYELDLFDVIETARS